MSTSRKLIRQVMRELAKRPRPVTAKMSAHLAKMRAARAAKKKIQTT